MFQKQTDFVIKETFWWHSSPTDAWCWCSISVYNCPLYNLLCGGQVGLWLAMAEKSLAVVGCCSCWTITLWTAAACGLK